MKVKRAQAIEVFLCDDCAAVHIGLFRNGHMFAEAIPVDPDKLAADLADRIAASKRRKAAPHPQLN